MKNVSRHNQYPSAFISGGGTTSIHPRNPYIIAWWNAAFPGFGHLLLSKISRGLILFMWEVVVNLHTNLNSAILYSIQGHFSEAMAILDTKWLFMYMPVYLFGIWDAYRTTVDLNNLYTLIETRKTPIKRFSISRFEINHLDKRRPLMAVMWSLFIPGLGQLYLHQIIIAFFSISWTLIFLYFSNFFDALHLLFLGDINMATATLDPMWFLFMPSLYGFSVYHAYISTVEFNNLFDREQTRFLNSNYQQGPYPLPQTTFKRE
ncbi:MAG TPA: hypothetical protein VK111_00625 [Virgibacillus sp.]|nr:hypothetical protein [Virgibacillus sp.]